MCRHTWIFTAHRHIACTSCGIRARRTATKAERAEYNAGNWFYLRPAR